MPEQIDESSSSESDIENYLQKPEDLNLNSTFFKVDKTPTIKKSKVKQSRTALSDSDSDDPLSIYTKKDEPVASTSQQFQASNSDETPEIPVLEAFTHQNKHVLELEEAKKQVEAYLAKRNAEKTNENDEITDLLAHGEKPFDLAKDLAEVGFHPSDFESDNESEKGDWEEVHESKEKNIIPEQGVEITVSMPTTVKKKKGIDLMAAIKRRMNRIRKENQVYVHKVHLLCWIAHGNYLNNILNKENIMAMALSLLPTKDCYPPARTNLKYLEQITRWYHKAMQYKPEKDEKHVNTDLEEVILEKIGNKVATSANLLVYIFVAMLRALGMQCRIVLSLQIEPLRPPMSELCSLKNETKIKPVVAKNAPSSEEKVKKTHKKPAQKKVNDKVDKDKSKKVDVKPSLSKLDTKSSLDNTKSPEKEKSDRKHTRSQTKNDDFKKTASTRSKSASNETKPKDTLDLPQVKTSNKRSKSASTENTKQSKNDANIAVLETSESKKSSKPNLKKLNSSKDDIVETKSDDFKKPASTRSKSASNETRTKNTLDIPQKTTSNKRSKSASTEKTKKSKTLASIDAKVAVLEALEASESKKPNLKKLSTTSSTSDDDFVDKASWRRSKSPQVQKSTNTTEKRATRSRKPAYPTNPALMDSMLQSDDEKQKKLTNKNKIKIRPPTKRIIPQLDGNDDMSSSDTDKSTKPKLQKLKDAKLTKQKSNNNINLNRIKSPTKNTPPNISTYFSPEKGNVKDVIISLVKQNIREEKHKTRQKTVRKTYKEEDSDSDFEPGTIKRSKPTPEDLKVKVKKRVLPRSQLEALAKEKAAEEKKKTKGIDLWVEVFLEEEEKWISADVVTGKVHCIKDIYNKASHPVSYILSWDNVNKIKDVTKRYCPNWNTVTRKLRTEPEWWNATLKPYIGTKTARDKEEDEDLARQQLDQPLPKTISEYKDHPLYVLKRHLLKFQALYPENPPVLGFIRNEEVYYRECVYILHSRDIWLKHAKVVKPGEKPYKIVKARPKYDKLSNTVITDQLLEIFGVWQVQDYEPPTAENGVVPRNAYGNVELFKPCMLPKKCVHLQLPGLKKVAAKLKIDCAPAVTGFDFHGGWNHAVYEGFVVCEEFKDVLIDAWEQDQAEITKREEEKYEKRVFGNWRRLIKAAMIRQRLKLRYDFNGEKQIDLNISPEPPEVEKEVASPSKPKRPKFMSRK